MFVVMSCRSAEDPVFSARSAVWRVIESVFSAGHC
jgi:hypothetical protein